MGPDGENDVYSIQTLATITTSIGVLETLEIFDLPCLTQATKAVYYTVATAIKNEAI
jgi:hypothetical protein